MNHSSLCLFPSSRLLLAALTCLPLGSACSEDEAAPVTPTTFGIEVSSLDGNAPGDAVDLRCDVGGPSDASGGAGATPEAGAFSTLVVGVTLSPDAIATHFVLRPAHACGSSKRCGYIRIEGLDDAGRVLASVDTATTEGVLQLNLAELPTQLRATLINGVDQTNLKNPDKTDVTVSITPTFVVPAECGQAPNAGGAGGEGGAALGGAGGDGPLGGAAGEGGAPLGGAGGAAQLGGAGAGGLNNAGNGTGGDGS